ncbi:hypothetical protein M422DRAFT_30566 [Sphaerobolus stellatus SS14]|uniref:Uncharacterized protein n=1 Tax=Sphaerobolus stellatus (strain SS14) TaxID=990650 RepID=A0A0C9VPG7_SPHS4|nr:hypothetical protein M422DRAFT_36629 [Sphaerobolus stellatus SS14]KIJ44002.1 hypothetical protein M422DRAFT_30566 [Sphaerobolus stellatus SS14]
MRSTIILKEMTQEIEAIGQLEPPAASNGNKNALGITPIEFDNLQIISPPTSS